MGKQVRLITENNDPLGVVSFTDAMLKATVAGLDLVEVAGNADPPVCRIMNFGKFQYAESKKARMARKKQVVVKLKEVKFHPTISEHDYEFKRNHTVEFLEKGCKVKVSMFFRGREMAHSELGMKIVERLIQETAHVGQVEMPARRAGPAITTVLAPKAKP